MLLTHYTISRRLRRLSRSETVRTVLFRNTGLDRIMRIKVIPQRFQTVTWRAYTLLGYFSEITPIQCTIGAIIHFVMAYLILTTVGITIPPTSSACRRRIFSYSLVYALAVSHYNVGGHEVVFAAVIQHRSVYR